MADLAADAYALVIPFTLYEERGYNSSPTDPGNVAPNGVGGGTMDGITQGAYDRWRHKRGLPYAPVRQITGVEKLEIYEGEYWIPSGARETARLDKAALAAVVFDWGVNGGVTKARWFAQAALGVGVDGAWGVETRSALGACEDIATADKLLRLRVAFHRTRGLNDPDARERLVAAGLPRRRKGISPSYSPDARHWVSVWLGRCRRLAALLHLPIHTEYHNP